jgi:hypothetical protein
MEAKLLIPYISAFFLRVSAVISATICATTRAITCTITRTITHAATHTPAPENRNAQAPA